MKKSAFILSIVLLASCAATYDSAVLYHKDFQPGSHDSLRFDGYYTSKWDMDMTERVKPIYLYRNGSVWFGEELFLVDSVEMKIRKGVEHSWGNFKVDADTIFIERFRKDESSNNYRRMTIKGIIHSGSIQWIQKETTRQNPVPTNYTTIFQAGTYKPDSTANWTRTRAQFNK